MNSQTELDALNASVSTPTVSARAKSTPSLLKYRFMIFYRFALAILGGYLLASLSAMVIAKTFADYRASAAMASTLLAFCIHCAAFIWVFMVNKTFKASLGIVVPCIILLIILKMMGN
ncbi:hypothetical protein P7L54_00585 [Acinetobacter bereziniae]|uniref:Iron transporter n=2 Tax=Acinetobacter bereziniae TaxID=106648 RepID=N9EI95_ACIBZ|nr:hypothetical protein [Acinetobacter bereziniae]ENV22819.1 hypothetical protein F963_01070 [Acinetobacter bereziniae NIPH 3]ENV94664.1 hypothetical protein F938_02850 [Acinetobacter bereziniae LMG 1003 = CIP 70.12]MBJ9905995.1 hypothetical protein [Acinetobacter bereziniae]MBJ9927827.1 hypothetical protein [Acinetobacter bereziniae]MDG3554461.1 hypothetical protein [Acinetobacter bereziniae]